MVPVSIREAAQAAIIRNCLGIVRRKYSTHVSIRERDFAKRRREFQKSYSLGAVSLVSSDLPLSLPRRSTAETE